MFPDLAYLKLTISYAEVDNNSEFNLLEREILRYETRIKTCMFRLGEKGEKS